MSTTLRSIAVLVIVLVGAGSALAQGPIAPQHSDPFWQAAYWNNMTMSGSPAVQRTDANLDFNWGLGSPDPDIQADGFSARWARYLDLAAGTYRFSATSDDGMRVQVDGDLIINDWSDHSARTVTADKYLGSGHHLVVVEYYENTVDAVARLTWAPVAAIVNWRGEYYNNKNLSGASALVRDDAKIDFNWGAGSPAPGVVNADRFSVRWTRNLSLEAASYRFTLTVDDGARLWVNNHLLIDTWKDQAPHTYTGDIYVPSGGIPVKLEYYENTGGAVARLSWAKTGGAPGTVIVDDRDSGFVKGGSASGWHIAYEGYNGRLYWTKNNDTVRPNYNWVRWYPSLAAGRYEVFVYIPDKYTTTARARYWVSHAGGYTLKVVDQSANGDRWVSLGTYQFRGTHDDYVSLADVTYEPYLSRLIAFDAVKWVPR
ncbi:MAG: hypothetical protein JXM73_10730 [Anaerolineae bacterium]|nr:hypothetical protein [Anaerolineae bacterium]